MRVIFPEVGLSQERFGPVCYRKQKKDVRLRPSNFTDRQIWDHEKM